MAERTVDKLTESERIANALFHRCDPTANAAIGNVMREQKEAKSHKQQTVDAMLAVARLAGYKVTTKIYLEEIE